MKIFKTLSQLLLIFLAINGFAQTSNNPLENTKWRIHVNPGMPNVEVFLDFHKTSLTMSAVEDGMNLGEYAYTIEGNIISSHKIEGGDPCPNNAIGKMSYEIKDDKMYIKIISDDCPDRKEAWVTLPNGGVEPATRVKQSNKLTPAQEQTMAEIKKFMNNGLLRNGKIDLQTMMSFYWNSPDFVAISFDGGMYNYTMWQAGLAQAFKRLGAENQALEHKSITAKESFHILTDSLILYTWTGDDSFTTASGTKFQLNPFGLSAIIQKINGEWKIIFTQESSGEPKITAGNK